MLGIDFFVGTAAEAIAHISKYGGLIVAPAAPSFIALQGDPDYRRAIADADLAIADSGWAVLFGDYFGAKNLVASLASRSSKLCSKPRMRASQEIFFSFCRAKRRKPKHSSSPGYQAIRLPTMIAMSRRGISVVATAL